MSLSTNIDDLATRIGTEFKTAYAQIGDLNDLDTTTQANLVAAINELYAGGGGGGVAALDDLTDVTITAISSGQILRYNGAGQWVNVTGTTYFDAAGAAAAAQAASQPLDSDLTAIAGLSASNDDIIQRKSGAWTNRTPSQVKTDLALTKSDVGLANVDNVQQMPLSYLDTDGTLAANSNAKVASQAAVKTYVDALINAANALVNKGGIDCSANPNYPAADNGHLYTVTVAGKIGGASGVNVEAGDMMICNVDGSSAGTQASVGANWSIIQRNIDGAVTGPASSTSGNLASFNGTGGKLIQDAGVSVDTDGSLAANSDSRLATQKAVKTYAQPLDATLTALAGVSTSANKLIYANGTDTFTTTDLTAAGRALLDDNDAAAQRTTLSVPSTTDVGSTSTNYVTIFEAALV